MGPSSPPDATYLVDQILAYTRVDINPKRPEPGERMTIETVPGILPLVPSNFEGTIPLPITGPATVLLKALIKPVEFSVKYSLTVNGNPVSSLNLEPLTPLSLSNSDPLMALLRVAPPLVPEHATHAPVKAELVATIKVGVENVVNEKAVKIPLELIPIPLPTLLVLKGDPNADSDPSNKVFVMTRLGSTLSSLSDAVSSLNAVVQTLNSVKDLFSWGAAFDLLVGGLGDTLALINSATEVAGFAVEEAPDLDDFNDFDDEARVSILFGPVGTTVEFFNGEDYNELFLGDNEKSTFTITDDFGAALGITTGFGIHRVPNWFNRMWDTNSSEEMDDMESCKFV